MQQGPAERPQKLRRNPIREVAHRLLPSYSSRRRRSSSSSFLDVRRPSSAWFINMGPLLFVSSDRSLDGHNLQKFQNCGVAEVLLFTQRFVDLSDRGRPALPEYSQDF